MYTTASAMEIRAALGNPKVVKRTLHWECRKHLPQNSQSLQDLVIEVQWITTGGEVLIYDSFDL